MHTWLKNTLTVAMERVLPKVTTGSRCLKQATFKQREVILHDGIAGDVKGLEFVLISKGFYL